MELFVRARGARLLSCPASRIRPRVLGVGTPNVCQRCDGCWLWSIGFVQHKKMSFDVLGTSYVVETRGAKGEAGSLSRALWASTLQQVLHSSGWFQQIDQHFIYLRPRGGAKASAPEWESGGQRGRKKNVALFGGSRTE